MADNTSVGPSVRRLRGPWREAAVLGGVVAAVAAGTFAYVFLVEPKIEERRAPKAGAPFGNRPPITNTPMVWPGVRQPPTVVAAAARVEDAAEVIGVSVGDKHRAYLVRAFENASNQVVNDLFGDRPVTVTYSDRTSSARAFTGPRDGQPLDVAFGGWMNGRMVVALNQFFYDQDSGQSTSPEINDSTLPPYPCQQTTWQAWRTAHPTTDIYVGESGNRLRSDKGDDKRGP